MNRAVCPQPGEPESPEIATGWVRWAGCPQPLLGTKSPPPKPSLGAGTQSCEGQDNPGSAPRPLMDVACIPAGGTPGV